jgi:hypothetical protein
MPAFTLPDADPTAIVAFVHDQRAWRPGQQAPRRLADLQTGNADAGRRYFDTARARCHPRRAIGRAATRYGLPPAAQRIRAAPARPAAAGGARHAARRQWSRARWRIATSSPSRSRRMGWRRSWPTSQVTYTVDDRPRRTSRQPETTPMAALRCAGVLRTRR